jgi:hypothetical protein
MGCCNRYHGARTSVPVYSSISSKHTTNNDSDLRELEEVNVLLAAKLVACLDVPKKVRAKDIVCVIMICYRLANDRILVGSYSITLFYLI